MEQGTSYEVQVQLMLILEVAAMAAMAKYPKNRKALERIEGQLRALWPDAS